MSETDWSRYVVCPRCGAQVGQPCKAMRQWLGRVYVTGREMAAPHRDRHRIGASA